MLSVLGDEHYSGEFDDFLPSTWAWTPSGHHGFAPGNDRRATLYRLFKHKGGGVASGTMGNNISQGYE